MRNVLQGVDVRLLDTDSWATVDEVGMVAPDLECYQRRKRAVTIVIAFKGDVKRAARETGLSEAEIRRVFRRCIMTDQDGRTAGFRAACLVITSKSMNSAMM